MKNNVIALLAVCALAGVSASAFAGQKVARDVVVVQNSTGGYAYGAMGTARNSTDSFQRIGCQFSASASSNVMTGMCDAVSPQGLLVFCETSSPQLVQAIMAIDSDSHINFNFGPKPASGNPTCTSINVYNNSMYEPKKP